MVMWRGFKYLQADGKNVMRVDLGMEKSWNIQMMIYGR